MRGAAALCLVSISLPVAASVERTTTQSNKGGVEAPHSHRTWLLEWVRCSPETLQQEAAARLCGESDALEGIKQGAYS